MTGYRITDAERGTTTTPPVPHTPHGTHAPARSRPRPLSLAPLIGSATACAAAARAGAVGGVAAAPRVARASAVRHRPPRPPRRGASPRLAYRRRHAAARAADAARRGPAFASRKRLGAARAADRATALARDGSAASRWQEPNTPPREGGATGDRQPRGRQRVELPPRARHHLPSARG